MTDEGWSRLREWAGEDERVSKREKEWSWVEESWRGRGSWRVEKARVKKVERKKENKKVEKENEKKIESKKKWRKKWDQM